MPPAEAREGTPRRRGMTGVLQMRRKEGRRLKQSIGRRGDDIWAWMQTGDSKRRRAQWQKSKKVSENNNQPDDQHGGEMGLRGASARERHSGGRQPTLHCASVAISGHVRHDRTADRARRAVKPVVHDRCAARRRRRGRTNQRRCGGGAGRGVPWGPRESVRRFGRHGRQLLTAQRVIEAALTIILTPLGWMCN